jgi:Ankyrin repeats (3 copies)
MQVIFTQVSDQGLIDLLHIKDKEGLTPLHDAARKAGFETVEFLLTQIKDQSDLKVLLFEKDSLGRTPLHWACSHSVPNVIRVLLEHIKRSQTDLIDAVLLIDTNRKTPLHEAISNRFDKYLDTPTQSLLTIINAIEDLAGLKQRLFTLDNVPTTSSETHARQVLQQQIIDYLQTYKQGETLQAQVSIQTTYRKFSRSLYQKFPHVEIKAVRQGFYLPAYHARNLETQGRCIAITRAFSQALFLDQAPAFLTSMENTATLYERSAQGKPLSVREEQERLALHQLLNQFESHNARSLPKSLTIKTTTYETLQKLTADLSNQKEMAWHLVIDNHVVSIYHHNNQYTYFDSNIAYISGIKTVPKLIHVLKEAIQQAGYKFDTKGFLIERFNVHLANQQLTEIQKRILTTEIQTERQRLMQQDKTLGSLTINEQKITRVQLYDLGTKIYLENTKPLAILIHADMQLDQEKLNQYLQTKKIELTARDYLNTVRKEHNVELIRITQTIPFSDGAGQTTLTQAQAIQAAAHDPKKLKTLIQTQQNKNMMLNAAGRITFLREPLFDSSVIHSLTGTNP